MLDPKGNTAVYVLYAYARIAGVLRRAAPLEELTGRELRLVEPSDAYAALGDIDSVDTIDVVIYRLYIDGNYV